MKRDRLGGAAAIVAAVSFAFVMFSVKLPGGNDTGQDVIDWYAKRGNRILALVDAYLLAVAAVAVGIVVIALVRRLQASDGDGADTVLAVGMSGTALATLLLGGAGAMAAIPASIMFTDGGKASQETVTLGWVAGLVIILGMWAAAAVIGVVSFSARRSHMLPGWLVVLGFVCVAALLASAAYVTMLALPIWLLGTAAVLLREHAVSETHVAPTGTTAVPTPG